MAAARLTAGERRGRDERRDGCGIAQLFGARRSRHRLEPRDGLREPSRVALDTDVSIHFIA